MVLDLLLLLASIKSKLVLINLNASAILERASPLTTIFSFTSDFGISPKKGIETTSSMSFLL